MGGRPKENNRGGGRRTMRDPRFDDDTATPMRPATEEEHARALEFVAADREAPAGRRFVGGDRRDVQAAQQTNVERLLRCVLAERCHRSRPVYAVDARYFGGHPSHRIGSLQAGPEERHSRCAGRGRSLEKRRRSIFALGVAFRREPILPPTNARLWHAAPPERARVARGARSFASAEPGGRYRLAIPCF